MEQTSAQPLIWTVSEAAQRLSLSRSVVYMLMASGQLKSVKIGKARRVLDADIRDFLERVRACDEPLRIGAQLEVVSAHQEVGCGN